MSIIVSKSTVPGLSGLTISRLRQLPSRHRATAVLLGVVLLALMAASSVPGRVGAAAKLAIARELESQFERTDLSQGGPIAGIVVLGGGIERTTSGLELARHLPAARVILTGPGPDEASLLSRDADVARRLVIDRQSRNTFDNAISSQRIAAPKRGERWLLVTTALHMPRAMAAFKAVGFNVEPWPVPHRHPDGVFTRTVLHELIGLYYYRLRGYVRTLL